MDSKCVNRILTNTVALIQFCTEEQFGVVIPEALAMGVPIIVAKNCGARDELVRCGVNGFVIEQDNPSGIAHFMDLVGSDICLWSKLACAATEWASIADVSWFAKGCEELIAVEPIQSK